MVRDFLSEPPRFVGLRMEFMTGGRRYGPYASYVSADGLRWRKQRNVSQLIMADRSTFFLNPLRRPPMWVYSLRENLCSGGPSGHLRARRFWERPHGDAGQGLTYRPFIQLLPMRRLAAGRARALVRTRWARLSRGRV